MADGPDPAAATVEALRMRLRLILMTPLICILGVLPLLADSGAGNSARKWPGLACQPQAL